jgi:Cu/Ag efflux pump CusA
MRWIVGSSLRSRGWVVILGAIVLAFGFTRLQNMPRDVLPEFKRVTVEVQTEALGLSAQEVEQFVTAPLEQDLLNGVAFLDIIRSESVPGLSRIEMIFDPGTDERRARQVVNERLTQAFAIPNVSSPPQMLQPLSSTSRMMMIGLRPNSRSLIDLGVLARWTIRPALLAVPGVANVSIWGQREQQLQVQVDPVRLGAAGVTLDQVIRTTANSLWVSPLTFTEASTPGAGGFFDTQSQRIGVEHTQPITSAEHLAGVIIEGEPGTAPGGAIRRLGDVTDVVENHQPLIGDAVFTDGPGLMMVVEKLPEANATEVTDELEDALGSLDLQGIEVDTSFFQPADYIQDSVDNLRGALVIALMLLVVALAAFLFNLRATFIALVATLLSMSAAVAVLWIRDETLNWMVLAGLVLALVIVIDDAITTVYAIRRVRTRRADRDDQEAIGRRYVDAVLAVRGPLAYGLPIVLAMLVPILVLEGEAGAFMPPLVLSYAGAVIASFVVAITVTPALGMALLRTEEGPRMAAVLGLLRRRYGKRLARLTRTATPALAVTFVLLVVGLAALPYLDRGASVVPEFEDRSLLVRWEGAPGTSLPETQRIVARAGEEISGLPGVENVGGHVGRAILGDQVVGVNSSELWVTVEPAADYSATVDAIDQVVHGYPGVAGSVSTYPRARVNDVLNTPNGAVGKDLAVRAFGANLDTLRSAAGDVRDAIAGVDGVASADLQQPTVEPTIDVEVDLDRAERLGIKPGDVRRTAATLLNGIVVGNLFEAQKIFEVVVQGSDNLRHSIDDVRNLRVDLPDGRQVPLGSVANVSIVPSPNVIKHEDVSRYLDIGIDVSGRDVDAVADDIERAIRAVDFPLEYHAEVLDDYRSSKSDRLFFIGLAVSALLGIFLLLQAALSSWRMAAALFVALPAALTGGLLAALIDGGPITIGSLAGFLAVYGLAARAGVLFVQRCHAIEDDNLRVIGSKRASRVAGVDDDADVVATQLVRGVAAKRFAPSVATAVAVVLVFLPLVLADGVGFELVRPMAVVVIGGIVTTTLLNLFVLPGLYLRFGSRPEGARHRFDAFPEPPAEREAPQARSLLDA